MTTFFILYFENTVIFFKMFAIEIGIAKRFLI